ncbi:phosphotransferase [Nocardia zapadnayensis]|uniref:phosphotransferase family protein n=1 Tax=Nocardia rhamnosiphila TaxID=426716 RepID=UPI002245F590|nr:phosphotransferase [Nocardia zapadnayensis]MCX0269220.1 phosphotransferase [Nocardia zapadnayensis]
MGFRDGDRAVDVRDIVTGQLPDYRIDTVALLGEGEDNLAYEVNGELIVRFAKEPDPGSRAARVTDEAALLAAVANISPLPVPEPCFRVPEQGCLAYFELPGRPLIDMPAARRSARLRPIAAVLGRFLAALHTAPVDRMADLVDTDDEPNESWLAEATSTYETVADAVPRAHRAAVEAFLGTTPPADRYDLVFSHNDLGMEHVLVEPVSGTVTGVIDWSDAAIVDPAYDFGLVYRDLGPAALDTALDNYRTAAHDVRAIRARAAFYARCSVLEDMAYGLEHGLHKYLDKSLTALTWLYPSPAD